MERCQVYGAVSLVAGALLFLGCGDGKSPVQPTPSLPAPTPHVFSLSGSVSDTASRPLGGSRVGRSSTVRGPAWSRRPMRPVDFRCPEPLRA